MGSLFGKKKNNNNNKNKNADLTKAEQSILEAKMARDKIKNYIKKIERTANLKRDKAKEYLKKGDKDRAKIFLKMSKMYKQQIGSAEGQLKTIEEQVALIETTLNQKEIMDVLTQGNKVLAELQKEVNVEKFEQIKEDMDEMQQTQDEINEFFLQHNTDVNELDEDIQKEMDSLNESLQKEVENEFPEANKEEVNVEKKEEVNEEENKKELVEA
jgi:charged multivesicular body protein 6